MQINVNSDACVTYANRLEKLRKTGLPNAIRETLSKTAMDVKQRSMPKTAAKSFTHRQKSFFKAFSRVDFAKGRDITTMRSMVGFVEKGLKGDKNFAVKDLEQQEHGGKIKGRSFIPTDEARVGKSPNKMVKLINRISKLENVVHANKSKTKSKKQKWVRAAMMAKKLHAKDAFVMGEKKQGRQTLRRIDSISTSMKSKKIEIKSTPVYSFKKNRVVSVKSTGFMKRASMDSSTNMEFTFITEARKQIDRILSK